VTPPRVLLRAQKLSWKNTFLKIAGKTGCETAIWISLQTK